MPRHNRTAWRNDHVRADTQQHANVVDLNGRRLQRSKRARRLEKRRAA
jgi:hypothetical protein